MKKLIGIALVLALAVMLVPGAVFAGDSTVVNVTWDGSGTVTGSGTVAGPAGLLSPGITFSQSSFTTSAASIIGSYNVTTQGKTTYDVWGDLGPSTTSSITASVINGSSSFWNQRTGITPYGINQHHMNPVQVISAYASATDGSASLGINSNTSSFQMANTSTGFNANATAYTLQCYVTASEPTISGSTLTANGNFASFQAIGAGTADVDLGHSSVGYYGAYQVDFGNGQGCSTDADASFTGSGTFTRTGIGTNQVAMPGMGLTSNGSGTFGSAALTEVTYFVGNTTITNYSINAQ